MLEAAVSACDSAPADAGIDASPSPDAGLDAPSVDSPVVDAGADVTVVDALPYDAGIDASVQDAKPDTIVVDPLVPDAGRDSAVDARLDVHRGRIAPTDHWRDTSPKRAARSEELPMFDPPDIRIAAHREGRVIVARVEGGPETVATRWQADGRIEGEGREVRWIPCGHKDTLRVAVRSRGGVAVVSVRAETVRA